MTIGRGTTSHHVFVLPGAPRWVMALLGQHLPHAVTLLARLQSALTELGTTPHARTLFVSEAAELPPLRDGREKPSRFTVAYLDFAEGPNTEMYLYSTLEDSQTTSDSDERYHREQFAVLLEGICQVHATFSRTSYGRRVLVGSLATAPRRVLEGMGCVVPIPFGFWDKWLFDVRELPSVDERLPEGMFFEAASREDCGVILSRSTSPRTMSSLVRLPSMMIKLRDKTPIAWALLALDGSIICLYCEEPYRGKGLAKKLFAKLYRDNADRYTDGAFLTADVLSTNDASRGVCAAMNGKPSWEVSWILLHLDQNASMQPDSLRDVLDLFASESPTFTILGE